MTLCFESISSYVDSDCWISASFFLRYPTAPPLNPLTLHPPRTSSLISYSSLPSALLFHLLFNFHLIFLHFIPHLLFSSFALFSVHFPRSSFSSTPRLLLYFIFLSVYFSIFLHPPAPPSPHLLILRFSAPLPPRISSQWFSSFSSASSSSSSSLSSSSSPLPPAYTSLPRLSSSSLPSPVIPLSPDDWALFLHRCSQWLQVTHERCSAKYTSRSVLWVTS